MRATATLTPVLRLATLLRRLLCMDSCLLVPAFGGIFSRQPFCMCTFNFSSSSHACLERTFSPPNAKFFQFSRNRAKFFNITSREGVGCFLSFSISPFLPKD